MFPAPQTTTSPPLSPVSKQHPFFPSHDSSSLGINSRDLPPLSNLPAEFCTVAHPQGDCPRSGPPWTPFIVSPFTPQSLSHLFPVPGTDNSLTHPFTCYCLAYEPVGTPWCLWVKSMFSCSVVASVPPHCLTQFNYY